MQNERGLSSGVQVALLFPLAFSVLLLALQWALVSWADSTALAAAQDGARVAAALHGTEADGAATAGAAARNGSMQDVTVSIERGPFHTIVTVTGQAASVLPGWAPEIQKSARRPTERVTSS